MHQKVLQPFCTHMHVHPIFPSFFFGRWNTVRTKGPVFPGGSFLPRLSRSPIGILWPAMDVWHWTHSNGGSPACPWTTSHLTTPNFYIWLEEIRDILGLTNQPTNQWSTSLHHNPATVGTYGTDSPFGKENQKCILMHEIPDKTQKLT